MVLDGRYKADFLCYGEIVVELKAIKQLTNVERAQVVNQLRAINLQRGLLLNLGGMSLEYERITAFPQS